MVQKVNTKHTIMKKLLAAVTIATLSNLATAQEDTIIGIHLYTYHFSGNYNNYNPGAYVVHKNIVAGAYYNSEKAWSAYGGYVFKEVFNSPIDVTVGLVTGYKDYKVLPLIIPSIRVFDHLRFSLVPNIRKDGWGVHFSLEF